MAYTKRVVLLADEVYQAKHLPTHYTTLPLVQKGPHGLQQVEQR